MAVTGRSVLFALVLLGLSLQPSAAWCVANIGKTNPVRLIYLRAIMISSESCSTSGFATNVWVSQLVAV